MTTCPSVLPFGSLATEFHPQVGGKCASLGVMAQAGLPVPPGFAITTRAFAEAGQASGLMPRISRLLAGTDITDAAALATAAAEAREMVTSWTFPAEHQALLNESYAELCRIVGVPDVPVAVRSSATSEDSPDASFAGEHDTYLWVCGIDAVRQKVRECWASLFTERAIVYRAEMGYPHDEVDMAVAVQKMVRPRSAGVAFTLDPTNGDRSGICIDSAWGSARASSRATSRPTTSWSTR